MASQSGRSSGPFTASPPACSAARSTIMVVAFCAVVSNLPMWFQRLVGCSSSKGHPAHVSTLTGPGTGPGMRPVIRGRPSVEGPVTLSWLSCRLSAAAVRFLAVLSRHGSVLSLRSAYRWLVLSTGP